MRFNRKDILTVPNLITSLRLAATPYLARKVSENPAEWWWKAGLFALSDNLDGMLARLEDDSDRMARLGFRRSAFGRKLDPVTDKVFGASILLAGMKQGAIPKSLGCMSLAQKAYVTAVSTNAEISGREIHVSKLGKYGEFVTNAGFGMLLTSEAIKDEDPRAAFRLTAGTIAIAGVSMAAIAAIGYRQQAMEQITSDTDA